MSKVTLTDLVNLQNEATAVASINSNSAAIETALDNTLSRDGTSPNQMNANLDMNSNRVINLPTPIYNHEPLRLGDYINSITGVSLAGFVQTSDLVNTTDSTKGTAIVGYKSSATGSVGRLLNTKLQEVISVKDFGAVGDGSTDDTAAIQAAVTYAAGRQLYVPMGQYKITSTISSTNPVHIYGDGNGCGPGSAAISNSNATQFLVSFTNGNVFSITTNYPCTFRHVQFNTAVANRPRGSGAAIKISGPVGSTNANSLIFDVGFTEQYDCIMLTRPAYPKVIGCYADTWVRSAVYGDTSVGVEGQVGSIMNNYFFGTSGSTSQQAAVILTCGYVRVSQNIIIGANYGIQLYAQNGPVGGVKILDNFIENQGSNGIIMASGDGSAVTMVTISRNGFSNVAYTTSFVSSILVEDYSSGTDWLTDLCIKDNVHRHSMTGNRNIWIKSGKNITVVDEQFENLGGGASTIGIDISTSTTAALKAPVVVRNPQFVGTFGGGKYLITSVCTINDSTGTTVASLPSAAANGSMIYTTDGFAGSSPLVGSGSGSWAVRQNSTWQSGTPETISGGTVTQATSKSTGVTLNTRSGAITMNNAGLATVSAVGFTLTNSLIGADDQVIVNIKSGATANAYSVNVTAVSAGSCRIELRNNTAGTLSEAVVIGFRVLRGSIT